ncbi:MAG: DUF58 domain-containing protein [Cryobacterium sp.]|nr:DUF58 domain-containing protein [Cryobacterium sp.]
MVISGWFVALLLAGVVPLVATNDGAWLGYWLAIVVVLAAADLLAAASPRRVTLYRDTPSRVRLGKSVSATLVVENTGRRTIRGIVRDAWQPSAGAHPTRTRVSIRGGERTAIRTTLTPIRRGERTAVHVTIRSYGPLRLAARQATMSAPGAIRVLPPFTSRKHLPSRLAKLRELDGRTSIMIRGQGTEFDSLREYVRGDDVRSIDWRATARRHDQHGGQLLMVRTWRPERDRRVVIIIDSGRTSAARIAGEPRIDTAFESALLLAALATRAGDRVDLVIFDRRVRGRVQGASGPELLSRMVDTMANVDPELIEPDWGAVPGLVRSVTNQRALVVIATSIDAPGASRGLLAVLPQLTKRHTVVVSSVTDPDVLAASRDRRRRSEVYLAAAAERALLDQSRVAAAIRQLGADVVTGSPSDLPPALADRYLALKAAGRL